MSHAERNWTTVRCRMCNEGTRPITFGFFVSIETVALAHLARETGAFASSSFGAGFGGSVWALTSTHDAEAFAEEWVRAYQRRMPAVGPIQWFIARPGPPATEIAFP